MASEGFNLSMCGWVLDLEFNDKNSIKYKGQMLLSNNVEFLKTLEMV
jgi:hypothetical protein